MADDLPNDTIPTGAMVTCTGQGGSHRLDSHGVCHHPIRSSLGGREWDSLGHHDVAFSTWDETQDIANVAEAVYQYLRSLPIEQRMEAMGMRPEFMGADTWVEVTDA